jgi:hypothetical protein
MLNTGSFPWEASADSDDTGNRDDDDYDEDWQILQEHWYSSAARAESVDSDDDSTFEDMNLDQYFSSINIGKYYCSM